MLLAEELLLLLIRKKAKRSPSYFGIHAALAAAVLVELAETEQLTITGDRVFFRRGDGHPFAPGLDSATVQLAITHTGIGLYPALLDRLTGQGVLTRDSTRLRRPVWRLADTAPRAALRAELTDVLTDDVPPTTRTGALIGLLHALDVILIPLPVIRSAELARAAQLAEESWPVRAFTETVAACERSGADLPGIMQLDTRPKWAVRPSGPPPPSP